MYISLVVPFFNSAHKCKRLLKRLPEITSNDLEVILVDDGSTDDTYSVLSDLKCRLPQANITILRQQNKGTGGARNLGLSVATGQYVWFVDSDDDITTDALIFIKQNCDQQYDFIDFNIIRSGTTPINRMNVAAGSYRDSHEVRQILLDSGFIYQTCKAFRREFLLDHHIHYPEYCYYEDIPLAFTLPFLVTSFLKTNIVGYLYHQEFDSITRGKTTQKSLDRLYTSVCGLMDGLAFAKTDAEVNVIKERFIQLYLIDSVEMYFSITPRKEWTTIWRIMSQYRRLAKQFSISLNPFHLINKKSQQYKLYFRMQWMMSFILINDQASYFEGIRKKEWGF
ncbi:glycosyltransferase family 2 protein [Psychrobacter sp. APC 3426]|uniref:glycosyltransferase family 2 protein n=1 Tax=Psychrobacter sp. APC 3426 TaxID=3035177 RepID=UPI0025B2BEDB|nr:glycosyltransferase family 2 protein [Psychrobacter sp. APC 3426]MDN3398526.1 glycosyltransferase family 2 protein [Psychrobacter sp. APC 3426]